MQVGTLQAGPWSEGESNVKMYRMSLIPIVMAGAILTGCDSSTSEPALTAETPPAAVSLDVSFETSAYADGTRIAADPVVEGVFTTEQGAHRNTDIPEGAEVWGSWGGADRFTGSGTWSLPASETPRKIGLTVITGPVPERQVILVRTPGGQDIAQFVPGEDGWQPVTIEIAPSEEDLELVVSDSGNEWGEWIAVTTPEILASE